MSSDANAAPAAPARLPPFFPLVPPACRAAAAPFLECFSRASAFDGSAARAQAGREALAECAGEGRLAAYAACAEAHLSAKQRTTWQAPQNYLALAGATSAPPK